MKLRIISISLDKVVIDFKKDGRCSGAVILGGRLQDELMNYTGEEKLLISKDLTEEEIKFLSAIIAQMKVADIRE